MQAIKNWRRERPGNEARREPGIYSHVRTLKDRKAVEDLNCAWAYPRLRTGKRAKVAANLLHVSSYRGLNIIHTER